MALIPGPGCIDPFRAATNEPEARQILGTAVYVNDFHGDRYPIDPQGIRFLFKVDPQGLLQRRIDYLRQRYNLSR